MELSLKELFERLVIIETKFDVLHIENKKTKRLFQVYVVIMIVLLLTNIGIHFFLMLYE